MFLDCWYITNVWLKDNGISDTFQKDFKTIYKKKSNWSHSKHFSMWPPLQRQCGCLDACVCGASVRFGSAMPLTHFGPSAQPDEGLNVWSTGCFLAFGSDTSVTDCSATGWTRRLCECVCVCVCWCARARANHTWHFIINLRCKLKMIHLKSGLFFYFRAQSKDTHSKALMRMLQVW